MNKKLIGGLVLLSLLVAIPLASADTGGVNFQITVVEDYTISIPVFCEDILKGVPVVGSLEFSPKLNLGLSDADARPIDSCENVTLGGDYQIQNDGNVPIDIAFRLTSLVQGITVAIDDALAYSGDYTELTGGDQVPTWANGLNATQEYGDLVTVWQRVAADDTVLGGIPQLMQIVITSSKG